MPESIKTQKHYILQSHALCNYFCHVCSCPRSTSLTRCIRRIFKTVWWTAFGGPLHKVGRFIHVLKVNLTKVRGKCYHIFNAFSHDTYNPQSIKWHFLMVPLQGVIPPFMCRFIREIRICSQTRPHLKKERLFSTRHLKKKQINIRSILPKVLLILTLKSWCLVIPGASM